MAGNEGATKRAKKPISESEANTKRAKKRQRDQRVFATKINREGVTFSPLFILIVFTVSIRYHNGALSSISSGLDKTFNDNWGPTQDQPSLRNIVNASMLYNWLEGVALPALVSTDAQNTAKGLDQLGTYDNSSGRYYVNRLNMLLGGARIIQMRVPEENCTTEDWMMSQSSGPWECYQALEAGKDESTWSTLSVASWQPYQSCEHLGFCTDLGDYGATYSPHTELTYGGGGYSIDIPLDHNNVSSIVSTMRADNWLDKQTRFVMLYFTTYNMHENVHSSVRVVFEQPAGGGYLAWSKISSTVLFSSVGTFSNVLFICTVLIYALAATQLGVHLYNISRLGFVGWLKINSIIVDAAGDGKETSQAFFEILDYANIVLLAVSLVRSVVWMSAPVVNDYRIVEAASSFVNHVPLVSYSDTANTIWGINIMISILKCFKYLQIFEKLNALWRTVCNAAGTLSLM